jgi:hypothetical protein
MTDAPASGKGAARRRIQKEIENAEEDRRKRLLNQRIDIARSGVAAFQKHKIGEAVKAFHTYIRILEDLKGCGEGGLNPTMFDLRKDIQELLLISGVYWDLCKLYDRTKSTEKMGEFMHYMEKYLIFSRGMPFQVLCAETMRKYISNEKPIHMKEFKNAYNMLAVSKCFVAGALIDVTAAETTPSLRAFRDEVLSQRIAGRVFIRWYYRYGPLLAQATDFLPQSARRAMGWTLDQVANRIRREILE